MSTEPVFTTEGCQLEVCLTMVDLVTSLQPRPVTIRKTFTILLCVSLITAHIYSITVTAGQEDIWDRIALFLHGLGVGLNITVIIGLALSKPGFIKNIKNIKPIL